VEEVMIRSNTFVGLHPSAPVFRISPMQPGEKRLLPPYDHHVRILDNVIEASSRQVVYASRVSGLEFSRNKVRLPPHEKNPSAPAVVLNACEDAAFYDNTLDQPAVVQVTPGNSTVVLSGNENLSLP